MNTATLTPFAAHVENTRPATIRELALAFIVAEQSARDALFAPLAADADYDDPRYQAYARRTDRADAAKDEARDAFVAALDRIGLDATVRDKLGMWL